MNSLRLNLALITALTAAILPSEGRTAPRCECPSGSQVNTQNDGCYVRETAAPKISQAPAKIQNQSISRQVSWTPGWTLNFVTQSVIESNRLPIHGRDEQRGSETQFTYRYRDGGLVKGWPFEHKNLPDQNPEYMASVAWSWHLDSNAFGPDLSAVKPGDWLGRTYCLKVNQDETHTFLIGAQKSPWQIKMDGKLIADSDHESEPKHENQAAFLGVPVRAGKHRVVVLQKVLDPKIADWYPRYNYASFIDLAAPPETVAQTFSSGAISDVLRFQRFQSSAWFGSRWDLTQNSDGICPAGYSYDSCDTQLCIREEETPCAQLKWEVTSAPSCQNELTLRIENPSTTQTIDGRFLIKNALGLELARSEISTFFPGQIENSIKSSQIFPNSKFDWTANGPFSIHFIPEEEDRLFAPVPLTIKPEQITCSEVTALKTKLGCSDPVEVLISNLPNGSSYRMGIQTSGPTPIQWSDSILSPGKKQFSVGVTDIFPNQRFNAGTRLTLHLETNEPPGNAARKFSFEFQYPDQCADIQIQSTGCPLNSFLAKSTLTTSSGPRLEKWGIRDADGRIIWTTENTAAENNLADTREVEKMWPNFLVPGKTYEVFYHTFWTTSHLEEERIRSFNYDPEKCANSVFGPNAFSPNGDRINDAWKPTGEGIEWQDISVYNRWGNLIYTGSPSNGELAWDGRSDGVQSPPGNYVIRVRWKTVGESSAKSQSKDFSVILLTD